MALKKQRLVEMIVGRKVLAKQARQRAERASGSLKKDPMLNPGGKKDPVTNPAHYTSTKISPIEVIEAWDLSFCLGNTVKYIGRHKMKAGLEDLKKARWYLDREIMNMEQGKTK